MHIEIRTQDGRRFEVGAKVVEGIVICGGCSCPGTILDDGAEIILDNVGEGSHLAEVIEYAMNEGEESFGHYEADTEEEREEALEFGGTIFALVSFDWILCK